MKKVSAGCLKAWLGDADCFKIAFP